MNIRTDNELDGTTHLMKRGLLHMEINFILQYIATKTSLETIFKLCGNILFHTYYLTILALSIIISFDFYKITRVILTTNPSKMCRQIQYFKITILFSKTDFINYINDCWTYQKWSQWLISSFPISSKRKLHMLI